MRGLSAIASRVDSDYSDQLLSTSMKSQRDRQLGVALNRTNGVCL